MPAPDHNHFFSTTHLCFHKGGAVVDTCPSKRDKFSNGGFRYSAPVAITIVRAGIRAPFSTSTTYGLRSHVSRVPLAMSICAPNFSACVYARPASSRPEIPVGNPKEFASLELEPACPPGELVSSTKTSRPSDAP